jgi:hypothetical protein
MYLELEVWIAKDLDLYLYMQFIRNNGKHVILRVYHGKLMNSFTGGNFHLFLVVMR